MISKFNSSYHCSSYDSGCLQTWMMIILFGMAVIEKSIACLKSLLRVDRQWLETYNTKRKIIIIKG